MATNNASNEGNLYSAGAGKILIAQATGQALPANITAGNGITVTNGANSISIATNNSAGWTPLLQTTSSVTMVPGTMYICDDGSTQITYTLPSSPATGDSYQIVGQSGGGFTVVYGTNFKIRMGSITTTTSTGNITSSNAACCCTIVYTGLNSVFTVTASEGTFTYV